LVEEVTNYLGKSDYVYLSDFTEGSVSSISSLRAKLRREDAECHIVKNSILQIALKDRIDFLDKSWFCGHTALIVGGDNPSGVAKILANFSKDNEERMFVKGGVLKANILSSSEIKTLAELPTLDVLRAGLLALFNEPARRLVYVASGVPRAVVNVLQAKVRQAV
jgi:large subunit ribosomal protein L10